MRELKIDTSWVRGVVGDALTPELVVAFAGALATWADAGPIVIGRDPRNSSQMLRAAVVSALLSAGSEVIDLGVATTPLLSFAVRELGAAAAISITGSHNDFRWNALKFIGEGGALMNAVRGEELLDLYHAGSPRAATGASYPTLTYLALLPETGQSALAERYLEHLLATLDLAALQKRRFRIAIDFCNGAGGALITRFLQRLGCVVFPINELPSSRFAHAPAPTPKNMRELSSLVRHLDVDLGAAVNVDGDRVALMLPDGTALSEEYTLPLAAIGRLGQRPGPVVANLSTSRLVDAVAARYRQLVVRTLVGEGHVVDRGLEEAAVLAGEGSGGAAALPVSVAFDAALTLALVLSGLLEQDQTLPQLVEGLPKLFMRKGEIESPPDRVYRLLRQFRNMYADGVAKLDDGVYVAWKDAWLHIRASNTEPLLRVIVEAESQGHADALFDEAMELGQRVSRQGRTEPP